jgi:hypothetical protein
VTTTTDFEGWPCISAVEEYHTKETANDGSCRTGFCFYVSDNVDLNIQVTDSATPPYLIPVTLLPGFNFLSWCKESVLVRRGERERGMLGVGVMKTSVPEFSVLLCCKGMALTYRPVDPHDPASPYATSSQYHPKSYRLKDYLLPPSLTVLSNVGSVPSLLLLARVAGGGRGLMFERMTGLMMDGSLLKTTFHSLANKVQF